MASYERREKLSRQIEFAVPTGAYGAPWAEVQKAITAAHRELVSLSLLKEHEDAADDEIRVREGDDEVIVYLTLEENQSSPAGWRSV